MEDPERKLRITIVSACLLLAVFFASWMVGADMELLGYLPPGIFSSPAANPDADYGGISVVKVLGILSVVLSAAAIYFLYELLKLKPFSRGTKRHGV